MKAQTFGWLVLLALIQKFSRAANIAPFKIKDTNLQAKEGSCIEIKCTIYGHRINDYVDGAYWFWIKDRFWNETLKDFTGTIIFSTDVKKHPVSPDFEGRVTEIGAPSSLWKSSDQDLLYGIEICDLTKADSGNYSFRFVQRDKWSTDQLNLTVKENPCPIVFEKPPVVKEKENVALTCSTLSSCPSRPKIEGLTQLSQRQFPILSKYVHKSKISVSFTADWKDDGMVFSCQIGDRPDKYLDRNVSLTVEYAPKDTSDEIRSEKVKEGNNVTLTCSAKGHPNPTFTWFKNEQVQSQTSQAKWEISSIKDSQSGKYHCKAHNKHGETILKPVIIDVLYDPDVEIEMHSAQSPIKEGNEVTLKCNVKRSNPKPHKYLWLKNNSEVYGSQTYYIQRIEPEHAGYYTCKAINNAGSGISQQLLITVEYGPRETKISIPGSQTRVKVGHSLTFTCNTDANPLPYIYSWFRISKNKESHSLQWTQKKTYANSLHLNSVQRTDDACYICYATNRISTGGNSLQSCIEVLYPPTNLTLSMDTKVREGLRITINCTVESFPPSRLTLRKASGARYSRWPIVKQADAWSHNILSHTFNVSVADAGQYTCDATNSEGKVESEPRVLVVKYAPQNVFIQAQPSLVVNENTSLTLVCNAKSDSTVSFTWVKRIDGKEVIVTSNQTFTQKSVAPSDSGEYHCTASNDIGSEKSESVKVMIKYGPKHTKIKKEAKQQLNNGKSAVMLSCSSDSYPPVKHYAWYKKMEDNEKDDEVSQSQNYTVHSDQPGVYYCIAENAINKGISDPVELFPDSGLTKILICSGLLVIFIIIIICIYRFRCRRNTSFQQGTSDRVPRCSRFSCLAWRNRYRKRTLMSESGLAEPSSSRDVTDQPRHPNAQPSQPHPDRTGASDTNSVYSIVALPVNHCPLSASAQSSSAQKPNTNQGGHTSEDALNYASVYFGNKKKHSNTETSVWYSMVSMPKTPKEKQQEVQKIYENLSTTHAAKSQNPLNSDTDSSEDEVDLNYTQVTINTKQGCQGTDTDSSTSDEEYGTQYSEVKI